MNTKKSLEEFFRRYGCRFILEGDSELHWGILSSSGLSQRAEAEPLGQGVAGSFRLMTKTGIDGLSKGGSLILAGEHYFVEASEDYRLGDIPIYSNVLLRKLRERVVD